MKTMEAIKVKYRKNENWFTISISYSGSFEEMTKLLTKEIHKYIDLYDIPAEECDIVDIQVIHKNGITAIAQVAYTI